MWETGAKLFLIYPTFITQGKYKTTKQLREMKKSDWKTNVTPCLLTSSFE